MHKMVIMFIKNEQNIMWVLMLVIACAAEGPHREQRLS
jgi:hypothetical protein